MNKALQCGSLYLAWGSVTAIFARMHVDCFRLKLFPGLLLASMLAMVMGQLAAASVLSAAPLQREPMQDECARIGHKLGSVKVAD